jgi:phosphohistidine phosphatase
MYRQRCSRKYYATFHKWFNKKLAEKRSELPFCSVRRKIGPSMKTLYLLRHAKSSWDDRDLADFDRPLNNRGLAAAPFMGALIASKSYNPSKIVSSPARRARQTVNLIKESSGVEASIHFDDRVYEASPQGLKQVLSELDDSIGSALIVGHNPGMEGLIQSLTGEIQPMPTAALAVIDISIDSWAEMGNGVGTLQAIYRPKDEIARNANS